MNIYRKYLRNTHVNGECREDMESTWKKIPSDFRGVIHLLHPSEPMTIVDIMVESHKYAADWPLENNAQIETNPALLEPTLELLVNFDMIKIVEE